MSEPDVNAVVSAEQDGRVLSGVGASLDSLHETMDRHTPEVATPAAEAAVAPPAADQRQQKQSRGRERFSELTSQRKEAVARAETAERERDELRARLAYVPPAQQPQRDPEPQRQAPAAQQQQAQTRPKPTEDEIGTKYPSYADFVEDLSDWKTEQRVSTLDLDARVRSSIEADRTSRDFNDRVAATHTRGREVYADFDAVRANGPGALVPFTSDKVQAIVQHPQSEHVQYAIMKDGALAQRLSTMDPIAFGFELSMIAPNGAGATTASPATSGSVTPPAPMQPVGSGSKTTVTPSAEHARKGNYDAYKAQRNAERGVTRRP